MVTNSPDGKIIVWDIREGKAEYWLKGRLWAQLGCLTVMSADGRRFAYETTQKEDFRVWDVESRKDVGQIPRGYGTICLSSDGRFAAVSGGTDDNRKNRMPLRVWSIATGKIHKEFPHWSWIDFMTFTPDDKLLLTHAQYASPKFQAWDTTTGKEAHPDFVKAMNESMAKYARIAPDGKSLAQATAVIFSWNVEPGKSAWVLSTPQLGSTPEKRIGAGSVSYSPNSRLMALSLNYGAILLLETATGRECDRIETGVPRGVWVEYSRCGMMLGVSNGGAAPLIWDVTGAIRAKKNPPPRLGDAELESAWRDMLAQDAAKNWKAICALAARPTQAIALFNKHMPADPRVDAKRAAQFKADLESGDVAVRNKACRELAQIGPITIPFLQKLYASGINADARQRIEKLLGEPRKQGLLAEELRFLHAIEALEYVGTPEARGLLEIQAKGDPASQVTQHAKEALARLAKRAAP